MLALDPDEWPGEWESLLDEFPILQAGRLSCFEDDRAVSLVAFGPDARIVDATLSFLEAVFTRGMSCPNGGVVFLDDSHQVFRTNWELRECWDWCFVLQRIEHEHVFQQYFSATGAIIEVRCSKGSVHLQHLFYEHPRGLEGSRQDLAGVTLMNVEHFKDGLWDIRDYLRAVAKRASALKKENVFRNAFGNEPRVSFSNANS